PAHHHRHFPVVCTRIHRDSTAKGTGDALGEFKPGQTMRERCPGKPGYEYACLRAYHFAGHLVSADIVGQLDHNCPDASVPHYEVCAVADDDCRYAVLPAGIYDIDGTCYAFWPDEYVGRPAYPERRVPRHGLVDDDGAAAGYLPYQFRCLILIQPWLSFIYSSLKRFGMLS